MITYTRLALAVLATAAVAGCQASSDETPGAASTSTPSPSASPSPSQSTTPPAAPVVTTAPPSPAGPLRLSRTADLDKAKITVHAYREGASSDRARDVEPSERWASIDVRFCNTSSQPIEVTDDYWTLQSAGSTEYEKANFQDFAMPQQPVYGDRVVQPSKCTRGWISFVVQRNDLPVLAVYNNETERAEWALKR